MYNVYFGHESRASSKRMDFNTTHRREKHHGVSQSGEDNVGEQTIIVCTSQERILYMKGRRAKFHSVYQPGEDNVYDVQESRKGGPTMSIVNAGVGGGFIGWGTTF